MMPRAMTVTRNSQVLSDHLRESSTRKARQSDGAAQSFTRMPGRKAPHHVFEQFDPDFRLVTVLAQAAAKKAGSPHIRQEHLLMGLLAEPAGQGGRLLGAVAVDLQV
jgi:hypothetical protein